MLVKYGDYNVTILSCFSSENDAPYYDVEDDVCLFHYNLNKNTIVNRFSSYFKIIKKTNKIIKDKNIDFLIGTTHAFNCLMICMLRKVKKIACEHMSYAACPTISNKIRKFCYPKLSALVLLTNADAIHYKFIEQSKLFVIPNSLSFIADEPAKLENKRIIRHIYKSKTEKEFEIENRFLGGDNIYETYGNNMGAYPKAKEIWEKDILGGEIVERLLYVEPVSGEKFQKQEDKC